MAWSGTPTAASSSVPLMNAAGSGAVNSAANYRQGFIGAFLAASPGGPMSWRGGVIPTTWDATIGTGAHRDLMGIPTTPTNNAHVQVYGGNCCVVRTGASAGPYLVSFNTVTDLIFDPADPSNPRIDVAAVRLIDTAIDGAGAQQGGYMYVINGTASGSPVVPTIPADYIGLFKVLRPANDSVIGTGHGTITSIRKSTGVVGGVRPLLEGDLLTDAGSLNGELTVSSAGVVRRWDATTSTWRGTQNIPYTAAQTGSGSVANNSTAIVSQISVTDPGFPYRIGGSGACQLTSVGGSYGTGLQINVGSSTFSVSAPIAGTVTSNAVTQALSGGNNAVWSSGYGITDSTFTGAQTVYLLIRNTTGSSATLISPSTYYNYDIQVIPA